MITTNIAEFKNNLSRYLSLVEQGEEVEICKRNIPIAHLVPFGSGRVKNVTRLGCGRGTVTISGDLTEPFIPADQWDMLRP